MLLRSACELALSTKLPLPSAVTAVPPCVSVVPLGSPEIVTLTVSPEVSNTAAAFVSVTRRAEDSASVVAGQIDQVGVRAVRDSERVGRAGLQIRDRDRRPGDVLQVERVAHR